MNPSEVQLDRILSPNSTPLEPFFQNPASQPLRNIGKGQCGSIYPVAEAQDWVIKLPNSSAKHKELRNDYEVHKIAKQAFATMPTSFQSSYPIHIPEVKAWVDASSTQFWETKKQQKTPMEGAKSPITFPTYGLITSHIHPVPPPLRRALIETFHHSALRRAKAQDAFLQIPENEDCLIRVYLGRRRSSTEPEGKLRSLRNYPLHVDQMETLGLDIDMYAKTMGQALAVLHWGAGVDGNDVEFVLGCTSPALNTSASSSTANASTHSHPNPSPQIQSIAIHLLDFNLCTTFPQTAAGLKQLVDAFWWNDPYYPRPNSVDGKDRKLWDVFVGRYLEVSSGFSTRGVDAEAFIEGVVMEGRKRKGIFG
ncbi:hypothetical protein P154DRAFT_499815 [Amniculicola lignicola CBS 123094]|uniref:DUF3669 domain-containing protein n=1 Tax=Amniculicola lignicola CBS 123094 TaxID=1392246 RepID=A0A6A5W3A6_9PLEO|nr:hypothetical protein P154DRAFT_499815 [Amniculicola lignicola CBS 123094]